MRQATRTVIKSCEDFLFGYDELLKNLKNLRSLVGKPGQRRSHSKLKEIGLALLFTPTPEPFSDIVGLSLMGIAKYLEWRPPPLTLCDVVDELHTTFKNIRLT